MQNEKIHNNAAICPECMKKGPDGWKQTLLERARASREYAKVAEQQALERADCLEAFANEVFILPTEEEEKAIRKKWPGEWQLIEWEQTPEGNICHILSTRGERTGEKYNPRVGV
jgi:hypothetical protein